jgi:hypothetical protein
LKIRFTNDAVADSGVLLRQALSKYCLDLADEVFINEDGEGLVYI